MFIEETEPLLSLDAVLAALGNPHDRAILGLAQRRPVDAQEILEATGFSKSTVYRRLRQLESAGLLVPSDGVIRDGHAVDRYRSALERIVVEMDGGALELTWHRGTGEANGNGEHRDDRPRSERVELPG